MSVLSDLVGNFRDRFSPDAVHMFYGIIIIPTSRFYHRELTMQDEVGTEHSVDPDQNAIQSSLRLIL